MNKLYISGASFGWSLAYLFLFLSFRTCKYWLHKKPCLLTIPGGWGALIFSYIRRLGSFFFWGGGGFERTCNGFVLQISFSIYCHALAFEHYRQCTLCTPGLPNFRPTVNNRL